MANEKSPLLPTLLPDNVVSQHIGQSFDLAVAQAAAFQLVRQIGDATVPSVRQIPFAAIYKTDSS